MEKDKSSNNTAVSSGKALSPQDKALFELGKTILKQSLTTSRKFSKFMITTSLSAIPIYLGLFTFISPEKIPVSVANLAVPLISPILFLASTLIFTLSYLPQRKYFSLDILEDIEEVYVTGLQRRRKLNSIGLMFFFLASILAIISIFLISL